METTKHCNICNTTKKITEFHKNKCKNDGLSYQCKVCKAHVNKMYKEENKEYLQHQTNTYREENKEKIIKKTNEYYIKNKEKIKYQRKIYREENKEALKEYDKKYNKKYKKNREKLREYNKKYNKENKDLINEWRKTPKGIASTRNTQHKRRMVLGDGDVTTQQLQDLISKSARCYWCNDSIKNKKIHIDHYYPISKGGKHTISNLVIACEKCNQSKCAEDPIKFANRVGKLL